MVNVVLVGRGVDVVEYAVVNVVEYAVVNSVSSSEGLLELGRGMDEVLAG